MNFFSLFKKEEPIVSRETEQEGPVYQSYEARLPDQPLPTGNLDPRSPTWAFIKNWAEESMQKAREKNDNINRDLIQTSMLRGEVKILKELINLPNTKSVKGLLEEED
jgi:hypothetical protein